jgi:hypothetical protein
MAMAPGTTESQDKTSQDKTLKHQIVVVDLNEAQSSQQVKQLRKGQGQLMTHVERIVNELIEAGTVKATAQPVVIVVREHMSFMGFGEDD